MKTLFILFILTITTQAFSQNLNNSKLILKKIVQTVSNSNSIPVIIFDLDDTLFDSSSRTKIIFTELSKNKKLQTRFPAEINNIKLIKTQNIRYSILETLKTHGIRNKEFINIVLDFWKKRFFTNKYATKDKAIKGASSYVKKIHNSGATIVYLTGRDHQMRAGTKKSLRDSNFPLNSKAILITKPNPEMADIEYKKEAFIEISKLGDIVAFFENEPENLNAMIDYFPSDAFAIFLDTKHSPTDERPYKSAIFLKNYLTTK